MTKITSKRRFDLFDFHDCEWKTMGMVGQAKTHGEGTGTNKGGAVEGACRRRDKRRGREGGAAPESRRLMSFSPASRRYS